MVAPIPSPFNSDSPISEDLTRKILQRTQNISTTCSEELRLPYRHSPWKKPAFFGACLVAITGLFGGAIYLVGAPDPSQEIIAQWPATPAGGLALVGNEDIAKLRQSGWTCPDLHALGFKLDQAQGAVLDGSPTLKLTLSDGGNSVTVYERHSTSSGSTAPMNPLTGHPASQDGFQPLGGGKVWLQPGPTWQAVLASGDTSYLMVSNMPPSSLKPATAALTSGPTSNSTLAVTGPSNDLSSRLMRGLARILAME